MKYRGYLLILVGVFAMSFVSAIYFGDPASGLQRGMEQIIEIIERMAYPLSMVFFGGSAYVFEKVLFLAIILSIVFIVLKKIPVFEEAPKPILWIVVIAVSLLSTRFLVESELIVAMLVPYKALGVTLTAVLPLIIYFFFVINGFSGDSVGHRVMRRILWIFFAVVFFGVGASRSNEIGELSWIYTGTAFVAIIFLFADGTINRAIVKMKYGELTHDATIVEIQSLRNELAEFERKQRLPATALHESDYKRITKRIKKSIKELQKTL